MLGIKAVFLDRDGTLSMDVGYPRFWSDFKPFPWTLSALKILLNKGYQLFLITNQSGIARGYFTLSEARQLNRLILEYFNTEGINFTDYRMCPHHPKGLVPEFTLDCDCRKPKPGMILQLAQRYGIALSQSYMVGDKITDIQAGKAAGTQIALLTCHSIEEYQKRKQAGFSPKTEEERLEILREFGEKPAPLAENEFFSLLEFAQSVPG